MNESEEVSEVYKFISLRYFSEFEFFTLSVTSPIFNQLCGVTMYVNELGILRLGFLQPISTTRLHDHSSFISNM